jgi:hypothetical protein
MCLVSFYVLTAMSMKIAVVWDVAPFSVAETVRHFGGAYCFHHHDHDGYSKHVWNVTELVPVYANPHAFILYSWLSSFFRLRWNSFCIEWFFVYYLLYI